MMKSIKQLMDLSNRVALVTGGAGHIGRACCSTLAELGASVIVLDFDRESCEQTARVLNAEYGVEAMPLVVDLADEEALKLVPQLVLERFGRLDILVHCAALVGTSQLKGWGVPFAEQSIETWRLALEINLTAPFILTQACRAALQDSGHGSVILFSSIYGIVGPQMDLYKGTNMGNPAAYAASKGGGIQLAKWLTTVMAPEVRVNVISPGGVWRDQADAFHEKYKAHTPLGRMATEEDLKGAVAYLASDLSDYVTGQNLVVDGGWTTW